MILYKFCCNAIYTMCYNPLNRFHGNLYNYQNRFHYTFPRSYFYNYQSIYLHKHQYRYNRNPLDLSLLLLFLRHYSVTLKHSPVRHLLRKPLCYMMPKQYLR